MCEFSPSTICFLKESDVIEPINDGHSGALLYKVTRNGQAFFLKIFNSSQNIQKLKQSLAIYKQLGIKTPDIIDHGNISDSSKYYVVYDFINGDNLKEYSAAKDFDLESIRALGGSVGKELLRLKNFQDFDKNLFSRFSISGLVKEATNSFSASLQYDEASRIVKNYFTNKEIDELHNKLFEYSKVFDGAAQGLIHGDIKRSNIMLDERKEIYLVDLESMQLAYDIVNVKYQITWCLFEDNTKEQQFIGGFFDGLYDDTRPADFNKQVIFMSIVNFFISSYHFSKRAETGELSMYVKKCRSLFNRILPMESKGELII